MVKLVEITTFKDEKKSPQKTEKIFASIAALNKALDKSMMANAMKSKLKSAHKLEIEYDDAKTVLEIINNPIIVAP